MYSLRGNKNPTIEQRFDSLCRSMSKLELFAVERKGCVTLAQDEAIELHEFVESSLAAEAQKRDPFIWPRN